MADRPAHVRAGSGLARVPQGLVAVQDDSNFLALIDPTDPGSARAIPLPPGPDGGRQFGDSRANKHLKMDLEACVALEGPQPVVIGFGSGSTAARESIVIATGVGDRDPLVRVVDAFAFYAMLRSAPAFAGSQMNIEGAMQVGESLRFFGRGNGASAGSLVPVNATCDIALRELLAYLEAPDDAPPPRPAAIRQFLLGTLEGIPIGFTDAATWNGHILFSAAAERSPDAVRDGPVSGSVIGLLTDDGAVRWAPVIDEDGRPLHDKAEGLAVVAASELSVMGERAAGGWPANGPVDGTPELWVVADADDERRPSELLRVRLDGPWQQHA